MFSNAEWVVPDQFLLGMKNPLRERLKLETSLTMHQMLKEAITLEKEEQVELPPVGTAMAPVREDPVEQCMILLETAV